MTLTAVLFCFTLCVAFSAALVVKTNTDDLVAVVQVFRHGQRNPTSWFPNDPWKDESLYDLGPGQLTKVGKQQHYALGQFTRGRYGNWMDKTYDPDWFHAQTTDVDRTHMSCQSNLAAIFKPTKNETWKEGLPWQPIPVHPVGPSFSGFPTCTIYSNEFAKVLSQDSLYVALDKEFADVYSYLSNYTGTNVTSTMNAYSIYDTLLIEDLLGFELEPWTKSVYPEPLKTISGFVFQAFSHTQQMKRLIAGSWLKTAIYDYFTNIFNDTTSYPKYQMWSGHDSNIASILNTIGSFIPLVPPAFASTLYFELRNKFGTPVVNIYHKDDDQDIFDPITVKGCKFDCTLSDFSTALSDYLIDTDTWNQECAATSTPYTDAEVDTSDEVVSQIITHIEEYCKKFN